MRKFNTIIASEVEPNINDLWLNEGRLKYFGPKGWSMINGAFDATPLYNAVNTRESVVTESFKNNLMEALNEGRITYMYDKDKKGYLFKVLVGFATLDPQYNNLFLDVINYDGRFRFNLNLTTNKVSLETAPNIVSEGGSTDEMVAFVISDNAEDKRLNRQLAADILFNKVEAVRIKGVMNGVTYDTIGIYSDGYITALQKNEYIVFNVNFEDGSITVETNTKVNKLLPYVEIMIGDSEEVKQFNAENIPNGEFFLHSNYGYGVGTYQDDRGGFAHITSAYGNELFYTINMDGSIMPDRDYVKPNEPYTLTLSADKINNQLSDIEASALRKAGEIVIITTSGPITYTRTVDSTENMIYFTDEDMNGQTTRLTYNNTNKMLQAVRVPMKTASKVEVGGIIQGEAIENATSEDIVNKFNLLLAELKKSGVIANN